jgi:hypothetical protein
MENDRGVREGIRSRETQNDADSRWQHHLRDEPVFAVSTEVKTLSNARSAIPQINRTTAGGRVEGGL